MTVLVVEDDPDQLQIRSLLLRESGFTVLEADSCATAITASLASPIDCAVVDLRIPSERDGLLLIRTLKAAQPDIRIYVLTGNKAGVLGTSPELMLADGVFQKGAAFPFLLQILKNLPPTAQDV